MRHNLSLEILAQPDDTTCGPTCLHAVYRYYNDPLPLGRVINEVRSLSGGGTLAVLLGCHALDRGYDATIYTYNLHVFDPTWFVGKVSLPDKLRAQAAAKKDAKLSFATDGYLEFLAKGGTLRFEDLTPSLIRRYVKRDTPILTGLSSTYLFRAMRETVNAGHDNDIEGFPAGHFVVLCGYDREDRLVQVADPYRANPLSETSYYAVDINRLIGSILLGILTYDANMLVIEPRKERKPSSATSRHR